MKDYFKIGSNVNALDNVSTILRQMLSESKREIMSVKDNYSESPYYFYPRDEYDFDEDNSYETDDARDPEETESDTEVHDYGHMEIKEQMYQDKLANLKKQLQQLKDGTHPDYNKKLKKLEFFYKERLRLNSIWCKVETDFIERDYKNEKKAALREFEEKKIELRENLIQDLDEKKKMVEQERHSMELLSDSLDVKPVSTRKLRRRPNDPVPVPEKRRKATPSQLNYLLDDEEIIEDLLQISKEYVPLNHEKSDKENNKAYCDTRIEDGKLFFERKWFHRGQTVFVENKDSSKYSGVIVAITSDIIHVRKTSDNVKVKIHMQQLIRGKYAIRRRAP